MIQRRANARTLYMLTDEPVEHPPLKRTTIRGGYKNWLVLLV